MGTVARIKDGGPTNLISIAGVEKVMFTFYEMLRSAL